MIESLCKEYVLQMMINLNSIQVHDGFLNQLGWWDKCKKAIYIYYYTT